MIDLVNKKLWVMTNPQDNNYRDIKELTTGVIKPVAFPDMEIELEKLLLF